MASHEKEWAKLNSWFHIEERNMHLISRMGFELSARASCLLLQWSEIFLCHGCLQLQTVLQVCHNNPTLQHYIDWVGLSLQDHYCCLDVKMNQIFSFISFHYKLAFSSLLGSKKNYLELSKEEAGVPVQKGLEKKKRLALHFFVSFWKSCSIWMNTHNVLLALLDVKSFLPIFKAVWCQSSHFCCQLMGLRNTLCTSEGRVCQRFETNWLTTFDFTESWLRICDNALVSTNVLAE